MEPTANMGGKRKTCHTGRSFTKPGSGIPCQTLLNAKESDEGTFATVSLGNISTLVCDSLGYPVLELSLLQVRASVNKLGDALNLSSTFSPQILAGTVGSRLSLSLSLFLSFSVSISLSLSCRSIR